MQAYSTGKIVIKKVKIQTRIQCVALLSLSLSLFILNPTLPRLLAFNTFPFGNHRGFYDY